MARQAPDALLRAIERGERGGVFFLYGDENYLKDQTAAALVAAHVDPATRDFNFDQLRGGDVAPETFASVIGTPPMMAEWRVVLLRDAQQLAGSPRLREIVESVLGAPPPGLALILAADIPAGSKAQFYETLKRGARSAEFAALAPDDAPGWVMQHAADSGLRMDPAAARGLVAAVGVEMGVLAREVAKLREFVGERASIELRDVEAAVGNVPRQNRWEWLDGIAEGRIAQARAALPVLLDAGESGVGLVLALGTQFLRLALAAAGGQRALEQHLPGNQKWLARRVLQQVRGWTPAALDGALDDLLRADRLLKSTSLGQEDVLEELLLRLDARRRAVRFA